MPFRLLARRALALALARRTLAHRAGANPLPAARSPRILFAAAAAVAAGGLALHQSSRRAHSDSPANTAKTGGAAPPTTTPAAAPQLQKIAGSPAMRSQMTAFVKSLQGNIVRALAAADGGGVPFREDRWARAEGGEGISCVLQGGRVFEKAGVNVSIVSGALPPDMLRQMRARGHDGLAPDGDHEFFAAGISMVLHPRNPHAPTVHMNYRYFEVKRRGSSDAEPDAWWFGGGCDLTPSYLYEEDAAHFHKTIKAACDRTDAALYPRYKTWCDKYFYIPHRGESRGIGGIFFDDMDDRDPDEIFNFVQDCGHAFLPSYLPILAKRKDMGFTEQEKRWQQLRRGRYVEFNLVYDRGTKFGLATPGARIESILVSLPETARWEYAHAPVAGSAEARLQDVLKSPREWV